MESLKLHENIIDHLTIDDLPRPKISEPQIQETYTVVDSTTGERYKIPYNVGVSRRYAVSKSIPENDLEDIKEQRQLHVRENLNHEQCLVFDHVTSRPKDIIVLQAGPGTGKTFTMLTVANYMSSKGNIPNVVIYKRDLVHVYRFSANGYTVASFIMTFFKIQFYAYRALEQQLSSPMSVEHFINTIVSLLRSVDINNENFVHPLLILDEYTVIPKPFLLIIMMTLYRYGIGAVICGDRNQLQNIHNSKHAGQCSAYDIVSAFSTKTFNLSRNERCSDQSYNDKVNFIGTLSSEKLFDDWGYALVSAMFYENMTKHIKLHDTILSRYHRHLTEAVHGLTLEHRIPTAEWLIEKKPNVQENQIMGKRICASGLYLPNPLFWYLQAVRICEKEQSVNVRRKLVPLSKHAQLWCPGKYLPFLPLIIGNTYFLNEFSERTLCTLENIVFREEEPEEAQTLVIRLAKTKELIKIQR